jgi:hypothetical protein
MALDDLRDHRRERGRVWIAEGEKKVVALLDNLVDSSIGTVGLVYQQDNWKLGL